MTPLAFIVLALAAWLVWTGRLKRMSTLDGAMLGLAIVGSLMAAKGRLWIGGGVMALAALYALSRVRRKAPVAPSASPERLARLDEARELLGLGRDYDEAGVREAHRRLIARVHPDAGGTSALAEKINDARALLLRDLTDRRQP